MINFLHTYHPDRVALVIGQWPVYWYGLFYAVALLAGIAVTKLLARKRDLDNGWIIDLAMVLFLAGLVGARLWYVTLIEPAYFLAHPAATFKIWEGGLAIHGGIAGALLALWWWIRRHKLSFLDLTDLLAPALALGQAIGRWGNYFNQELFGRPTNLPWGIPIDPPNRLLPFVENEFFHPTFLYESLGNLFIALLLILSFGRFRKSGNTTLLYLLLYSILRFSVEFIRIDPTPTFASLRLPQWVSLGIIASVFLFSARRKTRR